MSIGWCVFSFFIGTLVGIFLMAIVVASRRDE